MSTITSVRDMSTAELQAYAEKLESDCEDFRWGWRELLWISFSIVLCLTLVLVSVELANPNPDTWDKRYVVVAAIAFVFLLGNLALAYRAGQRTKAQLREVKAELEARDVGAQ